MRAWITKRCLSNGVEEAGAEEPSPGDLYLHSPDFSTVAGGFHLRIGRDIHLTKGEALVRAQALRKARLKSLRKQIDRLESLDFGEAPE